VHAPYQKFVTTISAEFCSELDKRNLEIGQEMTSQSVFEVYVYVLF